MGERTLLKVLLVSTGESLCALPLSGLCETMRPLPIERVSGAPEFVLGVALIRGASVPVLDLARLLGSERLPVVRRFVTLEVGGRQVALAVGNVLGVRELPAARFSELPPLLASGSSRFFDALGTLDSRLLLVLREARAFPSDVLDAVREVSA